MAERATRRNAVVAAVGANSSVDAVFTADRVCCGAVAVRVGGRRLLPFVGVVVTVV